MFALGGYGTEDDLDERSSSWEPDGAYADLGEAIEAAQAWLAVHADGFVEVIEMREPIGAVVRIVSNAGIEVVAPEWPSEKPEGRLRRRKRIIGEWFRTPPGVFLKLSIPSLVGPSTGNCYRRFHLLGHTGGDSATTVAGFPAEPAVRR